LTLSDKRFDLVSQISNSVAGCLAVIAVILFFPVSTSAVELFRYRSHEEHGRELEYVFQADESQGAETVTQEKAAEIPVNWVSVFYHVQVGAIETQEFKTSPIPHWLFTGRIA
jgi:hypothetical protein